MRLQITDFNNADQLIASQFADEWGDVEGVLDALPVHLKGSDQEGRQKEPIFDPIGTNEFIRSGLEAKRKGWQFRIPIPAQFKFLGTDVDAGKSGIILEVQFSNYPFLLNNTVRSELFYKSRVPLTGQPTALAIIIAKAKAFPASNSTLYYEQAVNQLTSLASYKVFDVPIRLVGLFPPQTAAFPAAWTEYHSTRYSRTAVVRETRQCYFAPKSEGARPRTIIKFTED